LTLTISAVVLLGIAAFLALKMRSAKVGAAVVLFLFGFFAAHSTAAGAINSMCQSFAHFLAHLRG
jgi:hypothetical protein